MADNNEDSEMSNAEHTDTENFKNINEYHSSNQNTYDYEDYEFQYDNYELENQISLGKNLSNINSDKDNYQEILRSSDIDKLRSRIVEDFVEFSSLPKDEAAIVLIHYKWNIDKLKGIWYDNLEENLIKCGLEMSEETKKFNFSETNLKSTEKSSLCRICEINILDSTAFSLKCGHKFCEECWTGYILYKMEDLMTCINSTCPQKGCNIIIPESVFFKFLKDYPTILENYKKALQKNFTDCNSDIRWCPTPGCGICVRIPGHPMKEVLCECKKTFCFKCGLEGHRPCDCVMVEKWIKKNNSESENVKWLMANTKQCPMCRKFIEKNQGCNHMTCRKEAGGCGYEFCWICLGEWKPHGSSYYQCNKFDKETQTSKEEKVKNVKMELEKYIFYFDRFMNHQRAQELVEKKLKNQIKDYSDEFRQIKMIPYEELHFLDNAVDTITNSRRTLKYTYVFGFYMKKCQEKSLFEHNQYLLDRDTDILHGLMEGDCIKKILQLENYEEFTKTFVDFKNRIINLVSTINNYKEKLLCEIENKMLDMIDFKAINN
jgi:ariadne-1